jgi:hypothetical protein
MPTSLSKTTPLDAHLPSKFPVRRKLGVRWLPLPPDHQESYLIKAIRIDIFGLLLLFDDLRICEMERGGKGPDAD